MNGTATLSPPPPNGKPAPAGKPPPRRQRFEFVERVQFVALAPLSARVLVVEVWEHEGRARHRVFPGLSVRSSLIRRYVRDPNERRKRSTSSGPDADLLRDGFEFDDAEERSEVLFLDGEGRISSPDEYQQAYGWDFDMHLVNASWPAEADEEKLAPLIEMYSQRLLDRLRGNPERGGITNGSEA